MDAGTSISNTLQLPLMLVPLSMLAILKIHIILFCSFIGDNNSVA